MINKSAGVRNVLASYPGPEIGPGYEAQFVCYDLNQPILFVCYDHYNSELLFAH